MRTLTLFLSALVSSSALAADLSDVDIAVASLSPEVVASLSEATPLATRHGALRFTDPALEQEGAIPWLLQRLTSDRVPSLTRKGWAEALTRHLRESDGTWFDAWLSLAQSEADIGVQVILVEGLKAVDGDTMEAGLRPALTNPHAEVRAAAARAASQSASGVRVADALRLTATDADATVRAQSMRALGVVGDQQAVPLAVAGLQDSEAEVRLHSLRALQRLQPGQAREAAASLMRDSNSQVAAFAKSIAR